jgi:hypothetical protein
MVVKTAAAVVIGVVAMLAASAPASAQNVIPCANEGNFCRVPYPTTVIYGARGVVTSREVGGAGIPCSNRAFGDPIPGVEKRCGYIERGRGRFRDGDREERYERRRYN